jgi:hypothetical protein
MNLRRRPFQMRSTVPRATQRAIPLHAQKSIGAYTIGRWLSMSAWICVANDIWDANE